MSNFPTAFWKKQPAEAVGVGTAIVWETGIGWSEYSDTIGPPSEHWPFTRISQFPFNVDVGGEIDQYYVDYGVNIKASSYDAWFGFFLTGGYDDYGKNDLVNYHQPNPWSVGDNGLQTQFDFEADLYTSYASGLDILPEYQNNSLEKTYNPFVQSGDATGSFTLASTSNLEIKVSGLGTDNDNNIDNLGYHVMTLHLYKDSEDFVCSGTAPCDDRQILQDEINLNNDSMYGVSNVDMQQVKLYAGNDLNTIVNYQRNPTSDTTRGALRQSTGEWVEQNSRVSYPSTTGIGTFTRSNLVAGDYQLRLKLCNQDGSAYSSGAFYGFTFTFS
tara:strand:- start:455 stop:1441 length:987 start_codon:yes stop_codon:yes gene_type:complete